MSTFPDYYSLLGITPSATQEQIRQAYKKESLKTHPDRLVDATSEEKRKATEKFQVRPVRILLRSQPTYCFLQAVADAYYVLSDVNRRREYDLQYQSRSFNEHTSDPNASANFFANFADMFAGAGASTSDNTHPASGQQQRPDAESTFNDVFAEVRFTLPSSITLHNPFMHPCSF
jgi:curved DNA-binding protein CbpA